jgi:hypothetical protein
MSSILIKIEIELYNKVFSSLRSRAIELPQRTHALYAWQLLATIYTSTKYSFVPLSELHLDLPANLHRHSCALVENPTVSLQLEGRCYHQHEGVELLVFCVPW